MTRTSHVYLHPGSIGDMAASAATREDVRPILDAMYEHGEVLGYRLFLLRDREEAEDEFLHYMFDYEAATNEQFPFVYLSLTPLDSDDSERAIDEAASRQGFRRFR